MLARALLILLLLSALWPLPGPLPKLVLLLLARIRSYGSDL